MGSRRSAIGSWPRAYNSAYISGRNPSFPGSAWERTAREAPPRHMANTGGLTMQSKDPLPLRRIDHVRFFVGNARQSAYFYRNAFGFEVIAYAGLETRQKHEAGYVLRQGHITFVLTSPLREDHPECKRLAVHGDGVQDIALE